MKWLGCNGEGCHAIGIKGVLQNQKYGSSQSFIVGYGRKRFLTISVELEILPENTENK